MTLNSPSPRSSKLTVGGVVPKRGSIMGIRECKISLSVILQMAICQKWPNFVIHIFAPPNAAPPQCRPGRMPSFAPPAVTAPGHLPGFKVSYLMGWVGKGHEGKRNVGKEVKGWATGGRRGRAGGRKGACLAWPLLTKF